jgi:hypothetical protein
MSIDKKYTAYEAALAVLKKAEAMLLTKASEDRSKMSGKSGMVRLDTAANHNQKGVGQHGHHGSSGGTSEAGAYHRDAMHTKPGSSQHTKNTSAVKEIHQNTLSDLKAQPKPSIPGGAPGMAKEESASDVSSMGSKGIHKLSKFVGRMEGKKLPSHGGVETHRPEGQKGVHEATASADGSEGTSFAGHMSRAAVKGNTSLPKEKLNSEAKASHKEKLGELKAMPKPNLTKGE